MTSRPAHLSCIRCDRQLDPAMAGHDTEVPSDGTLFTSHGHYGSTSFDPMGGQQISVIVCDACLVKHAARVRYSETGKTGTWTGWEPSETTKSWVEWTAATHNLHVGFPTTLTDGTVIEYVGEEPLVGSDERAVVLRIDGIERIRTVGRTFKSRTSTCHITRFFDAAPAHRAVDPWYPVLTFTEGELPTFEEWNAQHMQDEG